jgi:hypothetical protein
MGSDSKSPASWGVGIEKHLDEPFAVQIAVEYAQRDYGTVAEETFPTTSNGGTCGGFGCIAFNSSRTTLGTKSDITLNSVQVPISLRILSKKYWYLETGIVTSYAVSGNWLDYKTRTESALFSSETSSFLSNTRQIDFKKDRIGRFDVLPRLGVGFRIPISKKMEFSMGIQREFSLKNLNENIETAMFKTKGSQTGIRFRLTQAF